MSQPNTIFSQGLNLFETLSEYSNKRLADQIDREYPSMSGTRTIVTAKRSAKRARGSRSSAKGVLSKGTSTKPRVPTLAPSYFRYHMSAFPQKQYETIRYVINPTPTTLATVTYTEIPIVLNGAYDPDSLSANQPAGWAKLMAVYTKCFVRATRVTHSLNLLTANTNVCTGITVTTNSTSLGSVSGAITPGLCTWKTANAASGTAWTNLDVDNVKFLGIKSGIDAANDYACTTSANPNQIVVGHVWVDNRTSVSVTYQQVIVVDFDCLFYDPIPVT